MYDPGAWIHLKDQIVEATAISRDGLHLLAGVSGLFATAFVFRSSIASVLPWLALLGLTIANEALDLVYETWPGQYRSLQWSASIHDFWNTMLAPTVLMLLARLSSTQGLPDPPAS